VAPVFIEQPHQIEALLLCHFLAMLTEALMEREIRASMKTFGRTSLLVSDGVIVKDFNPAVTSLQRDVLKLLHVPASVYVSEIAD
jgi:hypothetical protein